VHLEVDRHGRCCGSQQARSCESCELVASRASAACEMLGFASEFTRERPERAREMGRSASARAWAAMLVRSAAARQSAWSHYVLSPGVARTLWLALVSGRMFVQLEQVFGIAALAC
jgi:hypothetical protein